MVEIWKDVKDYEGLYQVSNLGRVKSLDHYDSLGRLRIGKILKPQFDGKGHYLHVGLYKDGCYKPKDIHRLVAETFISNPDDLPQVNHKDEDKQNNVVTNLEWCTHLYNNTYGSKANASKGEKNGLARLTKDDVYNIRNEYVLGSKTNGLKALSEKYGISQSHLSHILNGSRWGWLT